LFNFRICTAPALAPKFKLPAVRIPFALHRALKNIYCAEQNSVFCSSHCNNYIKCVKSLSNVQRLYQCDYLTILKICLYLVQFEVDLEMKQYTLLNHTVQEKSDLENSFIINMASSNSDCPISIRSEDCVSLCETNTKKRIFAKIIKVLGNNIIIKPRSQ